MRNGRCRIHGGKTPMGPALPQFKGRGYSKALPKALLENYEASLRDEARIELAHEMGLIDTRLHQIVERLETGEGGALWQRLQQVWKDYQRAKGSEDDALDEVALLAEMGDLIERGEDDALVWAEITNLIERRRRLAESERKRLADLQQYVTADQALALYRTVLDSVRRNVGDRDALAAITADCVAAIRGRDHTRAHAAPVLVGPSEYRPAAVDGAVPQDR